MPQEILSPRPLTATIQSTTSDARHPYLVMGHCSVQDQQRYLAPPTIPLSTAPVRENEGPTGILFRLCFCMATALWGFRPHYSNAR